MIRLLALGVCASSIVLSGCALSEAPSQLETVDTSETIAEQNSRLAMDKIATDYPAISASVMRGDSYVWSYQKGDVSLDGGPSVSASTRFNTYSVAKVATGFAFARLIEQGHVSLDTSVAEIAPDLPVGLHGIRFQDILSHTSGIRHYTSPADWISFAQKQCETPLQALAHFKDDPLVHASGVQETYSTFAFVLASELLIRLTEAEDFTSALKQTLGPWFEPEIDRADAAKVVGYVRAGRLPQLPAGFEPEDLIPTPFKSAECKFGGGGLIMSSAELARLGAALYKGEIMPKALLRERLMPWSDASGIVYGGGVQSRNYAGETVTTFSVSGAAPGGRGVQLVLIEPEISIAIAGNFEGERLEDTAWRLAEIWANER